MYTHLPFITAAAICLSGSAHAASLFPRSSKVLQIDSESAYNELIKNSNKATIVEYYAPWCGHCQKMKPAYEQAADSLHGLAQVVAINCDDSKELCASVRGFPTFKTVRPTLTSGKPIIQDYNGGRTALEIVDAVRGLIPNHVKWIGDSELDGWLQENNATTKAILFTDKGKTTAIIKAIAWEFYGNLDFAQIRNTEKNCVEKFGIEKYPTLVVLPGGAAPPVVYDGEISKPSMTDFIKDYAEFATYDKAKEQKKAPESESSSGSSAFSEASASHSSADASSSTDPGASATLEESDFATPSPDPKVDGEGSGTVPVPDVAPPLPELSTEAELRAQCLGPKTSTCVLALIITPPAIDTVLSEDAKTALASLSELSQKHKKRGDHLFPFYSVPASNEAVPIFTTALDIGQSEVELIAVNGRRGWWRRFNAGKGYGLNEVEDWIDAIRLGEGKKEKLPEGLTAEIDTEERKHEEL